MQGETELSGVDEVTLVDALRHAREQLSTTVTIDEFHRDDEANWHSELKLLVEMYVLLHRTQVMEVKGREWRATTGANMET
jgi:3-keto-L-gulonate-6-phosphate decarboxylase